MAAAAAFKQSVFTHGGDKAANWIAFFSFFSLLGLLLPRTHVNVSSRI